MLNVHVERLAAAYLASDLKINAVKLVRWATGLGLKEAKQIVDDIRPRTLDSDTPKAGTVRVRIAVAVDRDGCYSASGGLGSVSDLEHVVFVEADVPLPEPPPTVVVEGEVSDE